jgi:hypothetical protein
MGVIYENSRWRRLRMLTAALAVFAAVSLAWAWSLSQHFGLAIGDGAKLQNAEVRYWVAALVALIGLAPLGGILVFCGRYVTKIERVRSETIVTTLGVLTTQNRAHQDGEFTRCKWHDGDWPEPFTVEAPWLSLSARDLYLAYIIDARSANFDRLRIEALTRLQPARRVTPT